MHITVRQNKDQLFADGNSQLLLCSTVISNWKRERVSLTKKKKKINLNPINGIAEIFKRYRSLRIFEIFDIIVILRVPGLFT